MLRTLRSRLTYSNTIATAALFLALGGSSYAALSLKKNSVGTKQLKNGAVTSAKIKRGAVTGTKIANGAITGTKIASGTITGTNINLGSLGTVPSANNASHAASADNATHATNADHAATADSAPFVTILPAGQTLRGAWDLVYSGSGNFTQSAQSFAFALAAAPTQHVIPSSGPNPDPTDCPGTASNPQAKSGQFCVYVTSGNNLGNPFVCDPTVDLCNENPSRWGFFLQANPVTATSAGHEVGTWAVTG